MIYTAAYCPISMRAEIEMEKYQGNHYHFCVFQNFKFFPIEKLRFKNINGKTTNRNV